MASKLFTFTFTHNVKCITSGTCHALLLYSRSSAARAPCQTAQRKAPAAVVSLGQAWPGPSADPRSRPRRPLLAPQLQKTEKGARRRRATTSAPAPAMQLTRLWAPPRDCGSLHREAVPETRTWFRRHGSGGTAALEHACAASVHSRRRRAVAQHAAGLGAALHNSRGSAAAAVNIAGHVNRLHLHVPVVAASPGCAAGCGGGGCCRPCRRWRGCARGLRLPPAVRAHAPLCQHALPALRRPGLTDSDRLWCGAAACMHLFPACMHR